ncbi:MAG: DUF3530 family protein [Burkholderiales bacterium]|nr:DUF3530 family protein [Burkholderiales bacterium]
MMRFIIFLSFLCSQLAFAGADYAREKKWADEITPGIVVGDAQYLEANGHKFLTLYTEAANAKAGLVIVHGIGVHPEHGLIGVLRSRLADAGYTTLSIQMPVLAVEAQSDAYRPLMPEAVERIKTAVQFLQSKDYKKIAVVSHSLGSRMSHAYFKANADTPAAAWVAIGMADDSYAGIKVPIFDLYGQKDNPPVRKNAKKRADSMKGKATSMQTRAPNADHFFTGQDDVLVKYVKEYLDKTM